jgi:hypothetical protein
MALKRANEYYADLPPKRSILTTPPRMPNKTKAIFTPYKWPQSHSEGSYCSSLDRPPSPPSHSITEPLLPTHMTVTLADQLNVEFTRRAQRKTERVYTRADKSPEHLAADKSLDEITVAPAIKFSLSPKQATPKPSVATYSTPVRTYQPPQRPGNSPASQRKPIESTNAQQ